MKSFEDFLQEHPNIKSNTNFNNKKLYETVKTNDEREYENIETNIKNAGCNKKYVNSNIKTHVNNKNLEQTNNQEEYKNLEEFDKAKTKVLKYVLYKKRTEQEVKQKFSSELNENLLEDIIQNLKENGYISDFNYIQKAVNEFIALKTLSIKEIYSKLYAKGISSSIIEEYFSKNQELLEQYEISCAKKIILKKSSQMEKEEIEKYLYKKGYKSENIKTAFEEI